MKITGAFVAALLAGAAGAAKEPKDGVKKVAIIGAGAAGASAAYHLQQFADEDGVLVDITVFEKKNRIGGRTLTVNPYDDPTQRVELGASIFVQVNKILWEAVKTFNLTLVSHDNDFDGELVVWDGDKFVYSQDEKASNWWSLAKLFWKYGLAPYKTNKLVQSTLAKFLSLYDAPYFPFRSLTTRAYELGLAQVTGQTGEQFLEENKLYGPFAHDIVQASTRVNYASNLGAIHGLDTMVALAPEGASQVLGGNWQIFDSMVQASKATFRGNTTVTDIIVTPGTASSASKYVIKTKSTATTGTTTNDKQEFDSVIIAAPFQFSKINAADGVLQHTIDEIPYVALHVTLFASPLKLSVDYFNLKPGSPPPTTVLTTLGVDDDASSGLQGAGKAGFFSVSTLRVVTNPKTGKEEYLYKIFSPQKVTASFLSELLGTQVPETFTPDSETSVLAPISWYYPSGFYSYPKALPRVTFQDPVVGDGLYYTSGIESFISTMETSALMGKNVARLIVDDFQGLTTGQEVHTAATNEQPTADSDEL